MALRRGETMADDLISVALCVFNGEHYLAEQLDSILRQDYKNMEVIIVDDSSTDGSWKLLEKFKQEYPQIQLFKNTENIGFNKNFQKALSLCNGQFIAIADQDDVWHYDKLSILYQKIGENLLIYHDSALIIEGKLSEKKISDNHNFVAGKCEQYLLYDNCVSGHACLINRELLNYITPFPNDLYYDWWMGYTAANLGRLAFTNQSLVQHRRHATSSTSNDKTTGRQKRINNLRIFKDHKLNSEETKQLITELLKGYHELAQKNFSLNLFKLLTANANTFFYARRKSLYKKIRFIVKECIR
ncbi:glycosyltransferase [Pedobacter sp. PWIIR3]